MFGRKCDPATLLKLSNNANTEEASNVSEEELSDNDDSQTESHDPFSLPPCLIHEQVNELKNIRTQNEMEARMNVKVEQFRQKKIFDKKVMDNR